MARTLAFTADGCAAISPSLTPTPLHTPGVAPIRAASNRRQHDRPGDDHDPRLGAQGMASKRDVTGLHQPVGGQQLADVMQKAMAGDRKPGSPEKGKSATPPPIAGPIESGVSMCPIAIPSAANGTRQTQDQQQSSRANREPTC